MDLVLEFLAALVLAALGAWLGHRIGTRAGKWWWVAYAIPLLIVIVIRAAMHWPALGLVPPVRWFAHGSLRFSLMACLIPLLFITPGSRLSEPLKRTAVWALGLGLAVMVGAGPIISPLFARERLGRIRTSIDRNDVCIQRTGYTCGPAAAVTALLRLGIRSDEGDLAILARTSPWRGTEPGDLIYAMRVRYWRDGITCEYRGFSSAAELRGECPVLVTIRMGTMVDHWVTVLGVHERSVVYGDPSGGRRTMSFAEFESVWRHTGILVRRDGAAAGDSYPARHLRSYSRAAASDRTAPEGVRVAQDVWGAGVEGKERGFVHGRRT